MASSARPRFGTDGVRGTFGEDLTQEFVFTLGRAIARVLGNEKPILIGRDTRTSGPMLRDALAAGVAHESGKSIDIGILPTPGIQTVASHEEFAACAITASHNPASDNGVKVFASGGRKISEEIEIALENEISALIDDGASIDLQGTIEQPDFDPALIYSDHLYSICGKPDLNGFNVVLDSANGASYELAQKIFEKCGANVTAINIQSDGVHINEMCGATYLEPLQQKVIEVKADIGFAFDGDADRVITVDCEGNVLDGDYMLAAFAYDLLERGELNHNLVVATVMSNGALSKFLSSNGARLDETPVGDKYVAMELEKSGAVVGGEQSGHIIRTDKAPWGDGIMNALLLSEIYCRKRSAIGGFLSTQFKLFEPLAQIHKKVSVANKNKSENSEPLKDAIELEMKSLGPASRVIVRPSGTENVVRITVEGPDVHQAEASGDRLSEIVREVCA